ncbi:MAG TPA: lysophospholipid acyltransferase family protein [Candidatus Methylomirabilis sp.]|nr:lysophospholipid acyltransferase family protein [Candidatus Methylomirabilis sp.]
MRRLLRRLRRSRPVLAAGASMGAAALWLLRRTLRLRMVGREWAEAFHAREKRPLIFTFWHGRLLMMPFSWPGRPATILVSRHADGEVLSRIAWRFGIRSVRGSTSRGAHAGLRAMLRAYQDGSHLATGTDGPRGPRERAQLGVIELARRTGAPVVPIGFGASRGWFLPTWDRFFIPCPFARGTFVFGEALLVPPGADRVAIEAARVELERRLNAVTAAADAAGRG